jgi:hypothetical protein
MRGQTYAVDFFTYCVSFNPQAARKRFEHWELDEKTSAHNASYDTKWVYFCPVPSVRNTFGQFVGKARHGIDQSTVEICARI